jgi:hypothetical protein
MENQVTPTRMVKASDLRDWLLWLCDHYDQDLDTPENKEIARLGPLLEELGRRAGAVDTSERKFGRGACLLSAFDWERGQIEFSHPLLLKYRLGSPDPEALIARLATVTGIEESVPEAPCEPDYVV